MAKLKRELKWLYKALLKAEGKRLDLREVVGHYEEYTEYRKRVLESDTAPSTLKTSLPPIKAPQYLQWVKQYMK